MAKLVGKDFNVFKMLHNSPLVHYTRVFLSLRTIPYGNKKGATHSLSY